MLRFCTSNVLRFPMRSLLCIVLLALFGTTSGGGAAPKVPLALPQSNASFAARLHFDAASLRLFTFGKFDPERDPHPTPLRCRGVDGELLPSPTKRDLGPAPLGRCTGIGFPRELIAMAYTSDSVRLRIVGVPAEFDVDAEWAYQ